MKTKSKLLMLLLVGILALMALIIPRYISPSKSEFHVTNQPLVAFQEAQKSGKPIFLEFYANW